MRDIRSSDLSMMLWFMIVFNWIWIVEINTLNNLSNFVDKQESDDIY